jgi:hypothetical protein
MPLRYLIASVVWSGLSACRGWWHDCALETRRCISFFARESHFTCISSHLHTHTHTHTLSLSLSLQPSPQYDIHPAQLRRSILMYRHVPVSSGRLPLVPVVRNEKGSRRVGTPRTSCTSVYTWIAVSPPAEERGDKQVSRVCNLHVLWSSELIWSCALLSRMWIGSQALGRRSSNRIHAGSALKRASRIWDH